MAIPLSSLEPKFVEFLKACLPGKEIRVTSGFSETRLLAGEPLRNKGHHAVDVSHEPGSPAGKYPVHCPFAGTIVGFLPHYNGLLIDDGKGYVHGFLHCSSVAKTSGSVSAGQEIGRMGAKGAPGGVHLHYQVKPKGGSCINPEKFWCDKKDTFTADPVDIKAYDLAAAKTEYHNQKEEPVSGSTIADFTPRQAAVAGDVEEQEGKKVIKAGSAGASFAVWTNRVPGHEPWPRTLMGNTPDKNESSDENEFNTRHEPQLTDASEEGSKLIGRLEGEITIERGKFWRR